MTEKQFQTKIIRLLKNTPRCWFFKVWGGGFQRAGIPDLIVCVDGKFLAVELKANTGKPSPLQQYNIRQIQQAGGAALILYPKDFAEFERLLSKMNGGDCP